MAKKKKPKQQEAASSEKRPLNLENPNAYYNKHPVWSFSLCDFEHPKWGVAINESCLANLISRLKSWEGQTWGEILRDTSGRKGNTKNHHIDLDRMIRDAQKRLDELNHRDLDQLLSLSVNGEFRLWGILDNGTCRVIWLDLEHEICPSLKKHT